ncbi:hypothetical protein GGX14DRAFT_409249 [Mycena pura]|uniref:Uncharacterized protein n=1 Tax=Mycena pura TaxID=153505 RepID=A0AAD6Y0I3_9AGAR|nr:hypothetical protein GGX14DRAFT_409249 [Mycena pura]
MPVMPLMAPPAAGSSRVGHAQCPSLGTQLYETQFFGMPIVSLPPSSPAVSAARDGPPRHLDLSQLSARSYRRIPRRGPVGIVQNFPHAAETPRSPSPSGRYTPRLGHVKALCHCSAIQCLGVVLPKPKTGMSGADCECSCVAGGIGDWW